MVHSTRLSCDQVNARRPPRSLRARKEYVSSYARSRSHVNTAQNEPLPTVFPCLFCNHENSVTVKIDKKMGVGNLSCKVCNQSFQCAVNYLSAAVDVYADWVDACDAVAKGGAEEAAADYAPSRSPITAGRPAARHRSVDDEDDLGGADDDDDGMDGYGGEGVVADDEEY
ncbi:Transcription elongation factor 1 [Hyphodiscus hymeniophilus]|uniref:Transcription elongation factor 1 homolog n=1 Tax=Hyphodiscus hymeniophilus TaxID=353542 RepID=A0A9P7AWP7_9HELO|nr:Transcription elongation factor 1 [Hyphodiscus hymeniophilus]